jgi:gas vesicle protein
MSRSNLKYLGIALAGSALGAAIGLLLAPASGRQTRRKLARTLGDRKDAIMRRGNQAAEGAASYLRAS